MKLALLCIVIFAVFILIRSKNRQDKLTLAEKRGFQGEQEVIKILNELKFTHFHDILLKNGSYSTQIDHLVILPNRTVLVIETKNKGGIISGTSDQRYWSQQFKTKSHTFYNPLLQNQGHIKFLQRKTSQYNLYGYKILSLIVFTDPRCHLQNVPPSVIHLTQLKNTLQKLNKKTIFNRSKPFKRMILKEDVSNNPREVLLHKDFVRRVAANSKK